MGTRSRCRAPSIQGFAAVQGLDDLAWFQPQAVAAAGRVRSSTALAAEALIDHQ